MKLTVTNIFCVLGKPGSGRYSIMLNMLARRDFIEKYSIDKLVIGTTRKMNKTEESSRRFVYMSELDYKHINNDEPDRLIDTSSVDDIVDNEIYYEFILKDSISLSKNYIGITSISQYKELKKWANREKLKDKNIQINIYPVMVIASIFERTTRMLSKCNTELDIYKMCAKILLEKYEYSDGETEGSKVDFEIINHSNPNTCLLNNDKPGKENVAILGDKLQKFIMTRVENSQGDE